jgi:hypothetical protein
MTVAKEYEQELLRSWSDGEEQVRTITYMNREVSMENKPRYHTRENHEYLEKLLGAGHCIYCLNGCKIAERDEINKQEG